MRKEFKYPVALVHGSHDLKIIHLLITINFYHLWTKLFATNNCRQGSKWRYTLLSSFG